MHEDSITKKIAPLLPPHLSSCLLNLPTQMLKSMEEIRLRSNSPLAISIGGLIVPLSLSGVITSISDAYIVLREDILYTLEMISRHSLFAFEEEIKNGFITISGGHRVGLCGKAIIEDGRIKNLRHISSMNIRIARQVKGAADKVLPYLINQKEGKIYHTLISSPPQAGKTTLLRDLARQLSYGVKRLGISPCKVAIVDERSEIAGCYEGIPQMDVGPYTDILDGCPKGQGIIMVIRSMSPQVVVADEIGKREDAEAILEAVKAGVAVITSAHSSNIDELFQRPVIGTLFKRSVFERIVFLSNKRGPGSLEMVLEGEKGLPLYTASRKGEC